MAHQIPAEALVRLRTQRDALPLRCPARKSLVAEMAALYGISPDMLYRTLRERPRPQAVRRADCGVPRKLPRADLERYCEIIAAFKLRTNNQKGRHVSTARAIEVLEAYGMETPTGFVQPEKGVLTKTTVNRYLKAWGYDHHSLQRQPPAVRFQAEFSNECWQFDLSPSDLKQVKQPLWVEPGRGHPTLMLFSVVDDRSGVCYQEYRCVYGEDVEAALRFLFNAMSPKELEGFPFQGIPALLYVDNGPITKSRVFQNVMECLGVDVVRHLPAGQDGRRVTARSKGKVERAFRTVKEAHETLYHFHEPESEAEANLWLRQYLLHYNDQPHRAESHSRMEDWLAHLPASGVRQMCAWERFCAFAREPEQRKVGLDARISVEGVSYEVDADLAGQTVVLWWGLFDNELYVEKDDQRYGPFLPVGGPIPLHRYRSFKRTRSDERADRVAALAEQLGLPRAAVSGEDADLGFLVKKEMKAVPAVTAFSDPDPFREYTYPSVFHAKRAIAEELALPLAKLTDEERAFVDALVSETLSKPAILDRVRRRFRRGRETYA